MRVAGGQNRGKKPCSVTGRPDGSHVQVAQRHARKKPVAPSVKVGAEASTNR
jgi:hypothetical protein